MPLFRFHRELLTESMETVIEVKDRKALVKAINEKGWPHIDEKDLIIESYCYDNRIKWNTYIVSLVDGGVSGFMNGNF